VRLDREQRRRARVDQPARPSLRDRVPAQAALVAADLPQPGVQDVPAQIRGQAAQRV
jgi:hypothetical protein